MLRKSAFTPGINLGYDPRELGPVRVVVAPRAALKKQYMVEKEGAGKQGRLPRSVVARAALLRGLGGSLKEGYVLKNHGIVDDHTPVDATGDVIEKLKKGFKNFKKTQYKCAFFLFIFLSFLLLPCQSFYISLFESTTRPLLVFVFFPKCLDLLISSTYILQ